LAKGTLGATVTVKCPAAPRATVIDPARLLVLPWTLMRSCRNFSF
jgi:hypothetical protein